MKHKFMFTVAAIAAFSVLPLAHAGPPAAFKKCQMCHGKQLEGKKKSPPLVERTYEELYDSLTVKVPKRMRKVAKRLTAEEKKSVATYIFQKTWALNQ